jgi:hypothetical protein
MERILPESWGLIELGDVEVCEGMIWDIVKGSMNHLSHAGFHIFNSGYTGHEASKEHCDDLQNTMEQ